MRPYRFQEQFDQIQEEMEEIPLAAGPGRAPRYLYEKGHILARDADADMVVEVVRRAFEPDSERAEQVRRVPSEEHVTGVSRIRVGDPRSDGRRSDRNVTDALRAVGEVERRERRRIATRNHVVSIAVNCCPGDEPVPVPAPSPPNPAPSNPSDDESLTLAWKAPRSRDDTSRERPVRVLVIDTGLVEGYESYGWMKGVRPAPNPDGVEKRPLDREGVLRQYVGHGTFIAGLIGAVAPHAEVTVLNALSRAGAVTEHEFGIRLMHAMGEMEGGWPDIISLSAGTPTTKARALLSLERFMDRLGAARTLLVAAAGNNGDTGKFWPAAYAGTKEYGDAVVSVGALRTDGAAGACFTNHGPWVDVYAPGERLVSAFTAPDGSPEVYDYQHSTFSRCRYGSAYECTCRFPKHVGERSAHRRFTSASPDRVRFDGLAMWSGTSFATPLVVAMIANRMRELRVTEPRVAARDLLGKASSAAVRGRTVRALIPGTWTPTPVRTVP
ncbi:S8/S53 family peptidase [Streptosporangium sp. NPDC051022]|uniref:S8/S53 family peptidase n=1 Tax=Streptosporangium sp. NPDC051022 TaxID=3155752 RepID=UPI00343C4B7E